MKIDQTNVIIANPESENIPLSGKNIVKSNEDKQKIFPKKQSC